ncbi:hypothetical protein ABHF33_14905 [Chitinibacter sp. FCG-7]|uniref:HDOD domain-containing protein n=1 Tax=Chitinibacter mangrovi TaxID=3153927 RepID=A0AAU7F8B4_9NEIS
MNSQVAYAMMNKASKTELATIKNSIMRSIPAAVVAKIAYAANMGNYAALTLCDALEISLEMPHQMFSD